MKDFSSSLQNTEGTLLRPLQKLRESENYIVSQTVGVIDTTRVPGLAPDIESKPDYFKRKQEYSVNTEAVIGNNLEFLSVGTVCTASMHDKEREIGMYYTVL